jgi:hypothetical protein
MKLTIRDLKEKIESEHRELINKSAKENQYHHEIIQRYARIISYYETIDQMRKQQFENFKEEIL